MASNRTNDRVDYYSTLDELEETLKIMVHLKDVLDPEGLPEMIRDLIHPIMRMQDALEPQDENGKLVFLGKQLQVIKSIEDKLGEEYLRLYYHQRSLRLRNYVLENLNPNRTKEEDYLPTGTDANTVSYSYHSSEPQSWVKETQRLIHLDRKGMFFNSASFMMEEYQRQYQEEAKKEISEMNTAFDTLYLFQLQNLDENEVLLDIPIHLEIENPGQHARRLILKDFIYRPSRWNKTSIISDETWAPIQGPLIDGYSKYYNNFKDITSQFNIFNSRLKKDVLNVLNDISASNPENVEPMSTGVNSSTGVFRLSPRKPDSISVENFDDIPEFLSDKLKDVGHNVGMNFHPSIKPYGKDPEIPSSAIPGWISFDDQKARNKYQRRVKVGSQEYNIGTEEEYNTAFPTLK